MNSRMAQAGNGTRGIGGYPLLVVVLNYRTPDLTVACLGSLGAPGVAVAGMRVVVVDNDSGDGSAERVEGAIAASGWGAWASVVRAPRNGGFAYGNNRGIEAGFGMGRPEFVLLLNSDTIVHGDVLGRCLGAMRGDAGVGVLSCRVLNADGSIQNVTRRFPSPARVALMLAGLPWKLPRLFGWADCEDLRWDREGAARDVDWVGGAFMMIRSEVLERLGGLDESFFFYGEDVEFCRRVWRAGWRVRYEPAGSITHLGGASSDPGRLPERARSTHAWNGRYLVQRRCYGRGAAAVVRMMDLVFARARLWRMRRRGDDVRAAPLTAAIAYLTDPVNRGAADVPARTGLNLDVRGRSESADAVSTAHRCEAVNG